MDEAAGLEMDGRTHLTGDHQPRLRSVMAAGSRRRSQMQDDLGPPVGEDRLVQQGSGPSQLPETVDVPRKLGCGADRAVGHSAAIVRPVSRGTG